MTPHWTTPQGQLVALKRKAERASLEMALDAAERSLATIQIDDPNSLELVGAEEAVAEARTALDAFIERERAEFAAQVDATEAKRKANRVKIRTMKRTA